MAGVSFTLGLVDKLSAPAKTIGSNLDQLTAKAKGLSTSMGTLDTSLGKMGASANDASLGPAKLTDGMKMADSAAVGFATGIVAVAAALGAATIAGAAYALSMTEAHEKTVAVLSALAGSPAKGVAMLSTLDSLRSKLGMTTAELVPMAEQLTAMGVKSGDLKTQLTALASVGAIGQPGGTEEYTTILKKLSGQAKISTKDLTGLYKTGVNEADLAAKMGMSQKQLQAALKSGTVDAKAFGAALTGLVTAKGAGALAQQANSLTAQWDLAKENFSKLFEGVNAGPFLTELKKLFGLLDQSTASGKALKFGITTFFNTAMSLAAKAIPYIITGIKQMINWALQFAVWAKPMVKSLENLWTQAGGASTLITVLKGVAVAVGLVVGLGLLLASPFIIGTAAIIALGAGLAWVLGKIYDFVPAAIKALSGFASAGASMASGFISGLVSGITSGISAAVGAVTNLGGSLLAAAKNLVPNLGGGGAASSPGGGGAGAVTAKPNAAGGVVQPAKGEVLASVAPGETIVPKGASIEGPRGAPQATAPAAGGGGAMSNTINISVNVGGGGDAKGGADAKAQGQAIADILQEQLADVFEKLALSQGLGQAA